MTSKTKESGKITKPIWAHYFARKFSASRFEIVMRVYWSDFYWQEFKVRLNNVLVMPADGGNHAICYDEREWVLFANKIYHKVCRNLTIFKRYVRLIKHT